MFVSTGALENCDMRSNGSTCRYFLWVMVVVALGIPGSLPKKKKKNPLAMQESPVSFLGWKIPWRRDRLPTLVFLGFPGGSDDNKSACNVGDLGLIPLLEDPLEEGMAAYSSVLAWRIPWTEETGGLQSMGSL